MLEGRIKKRGQKIAEQTGSIATKKAAAKTDFQKNAVKDDEKRMTALAAEQKADEDALAKLQPAPAPAPEPKDVVEEGMARAFADAAPAAPEAVLLGDAAWIVDGTHVVALDRGSGAVKMDVPLAGPALRVLRGDGAIYVVAQAGATARQVTRFAPGVAPQSLYLAPFLPRNFGLQSRNGLEQRSHKIPLRRGDDGQNGLRYCR